MSRLTGGDHFSESVKFEADGLDDIVKLVREARNETDLFHASQTRAGSAFSRFGGQSFRPAGFGPPPPSHVSQYRPRPSFAPNPFAPSTVAESTYRAQATMALRHDNPIPLAPGMPRATYGLRNDTISDMAYQRRRGMDASRMVATMTPDGPAPLPPQGVASWERLKRNAEQYREAVVKIGKEYDRLKKSASSWFHGDPMTRQLRENGRRAIDQARRDADAAERQRRRAIGFRGRFGEDWGGEHGYRSRLMGAAGTMGNLAVMGGVGVFGLGMAGLQGTVTGNRFNNEFERTTREIGNAFGPALREATKYLEQFNGWLSKLSPQGQKLIMYGGLAAAGYAGARALGMGGAIHGVAGALGNAALSAGARYGPGLLRAAGGGSVLAGVGVAGGVAYGAYSVARQALEAGDTKDFIRRIREGKLDEQEARAIPEELKLAHQRAGGKDRWTAEVEEKRRNFLRERLGVDEQGKGLGIFARMQAAANIPAWGLSRIFGGGPGAQAEELRKDLPLLEAQRKLERDGKLGVGGNHNREPLAGGGFESFLQYYQRIETAFGKIDKGKEAADKQLEAAKALKDAATALAALVGGGIIPAAMAAIPAGGVAVGGAAAAFAGNNGMKANEVL